MGFSTIIDIIGSTIIGGFLLLLLFRLNDAAVANTFSYSGELSVQENLVSIVSVLEQDLRKIGYCADSEKMPDAAMAIIFADTSRMTFLADSQISGKLDTVSYYLGTLNELSDTPNPNDRILYRSVNSEASGANLGITQYRLRFYDSMGNELTPPLTAPTGITKIQVDIKVENSAAYDNEYRSAFWRRIRLSARNLNNR